jgi:single-stranded-DNA-specific exonuclease
VIVASRLIETYYKPNLVLTQSGDKIVGSARSVEDFDIHQALVNCSEFLLQFGGHKFAAGLTMSPDKLDAFKMAFEKQAAHLTKEQLTRTFLYEADIKLGTVTDTLYANLKRFAPFGPENMKPVFRASNVWDTGNARTMGGKSKHLKMNLVSELGQRAIGATAFGFGHLYPDIKNDRRMDILFTIEENRFRGRSAIELMIQDIRLV